MKSPKDNDKINEETMTLGGRIFWRGYRSVPLWRRELGLKEKVKREKSFKRAPYPNGGPRRRQRRRAGGEENDNDPTMDYGYEWLLAAVNNMPGAASSVGRKGVESAYQWRTRMLEEYMKNLELDKNPREHGGDPYLWKGLRYVSKLRPPKGESPPLGLFLQLFEVAKVQEDQRRRSYRIKQVGDVLYSNENVRLDPVNESAYIDALFMVGSKYRALQLWQSRLGKRDVVESSYWHEFGVLLYIRRFDWRMAEEISQDMEKKFGYVPPKLMIHFIKLYCRLGSYDEQVEGWYRKLRDTVKSRKKVMKILSTAKSQTAVEDPPSSSHLLVVLEELLKQNYWKLAQKVIKDLQDLDAEIPVIQMLETIDKSTKRLSIISKNKRRRRSFEEGRPKIGAESSDFVPLLSMLISINPDILNSASLYQSWLRGLASMGLTQNAIQVLDAMVKRRNGPSIDDMFALIQALLNKNEWDSAWRLLERMESGELASQPSTRIYNQFLRYSVRMEDCQLVDQTVSHIEPPYNDTTLNMLLLFYFNTRQFNKLFELYTPVINRDHDPGHTTWRQLWLLIRRSYQTKPTAVRPDHRELFAAMAASQKYKTSLHVYEYAAHSMMLAGDYAAACAVLCYMETKNDLNPTIILATGLVDLALKLKRGSKAVFGPGAASVNEATVESGHTALAEPTIPWESVCDSICSTLELDNPQTKAQVEQIASQWKTVGK